MGYHDHPDGKECHEKIGVCVKYAGITGLIVSTYDVIMYTKPQGYVPTLARYVKCTSPLVAAGATFAGVTCALTAYRHKDDKYNYLAGGASAGFVVGAAAKTFRVGVPVAVALGVLAVFYKDSVQHNWSFFPTVTHRFGSVNHIENDYTKIN